MMKKLIGLFMAACLLAGCAGSQSSSTAASSDVEASSTQTGTAQTIAPLQDETALENTTDAILAVSLQEGDAYVDDNGQMQMKLTVYTYDKYDMVDIANLQVGDTIITRAGAVEVTSKEENVAGMISINGGQEEGGFDLMSDDDGVYYEVGFNDVKSWYEVGTVTIPVSADFVGVDRSDLDRGEVTFYPGDFLNGTVTNYDFTPYNTTVRVEDGKIVELTRSFTP